jgi:ATP:ADP antiporter, AAA family
MIEHVGRIFSLKRDEVTPASLLFVYLFITIGVFVTGQAVGDALFFKVFPRNLPYAMIGSALLSLPFATVYIRLSHRLRLEPLVLTTLGFFSASFVLFWWLAGQKANWVYMLIYIWVQTFGVMGPMMGWTVANYLLTTREARRVFGFIQAGAIISVPSFGFITADILHHKHATPQTLLLVLGLVVMISAVMVKLLFRNARERLAQVSSAPPASKEAPRTFRQSYRAVRSSRYLMLITALIAVGCLTSSIVQYQFKVIGNASYTVNGITDTAALGAFFARFYAYMGLGTMVLQMVMTGPLLRKFGIRVTLFILPVALIAPTSWVLIDPRLLTASLMRGTHSLLRYSVDKSSAELLYLPIPPEVKSQVKSFIDTFIWRSADGIAGAVLAIVYLKFNFNPGRVSFLSLFLIAAWIVVAFGVRREYLNMLRRAIERRTLDPERLAATFLDSTTTEVLARGLEHVGEQQALYGLSLFEIGRQPAWHPALRRLLEHASPTVRQRALRLLSDTGDRGIVPQVEKMLGDTSLEVRTEALHYLVTHTGRDPLELLNAATEFPDYTIQGSVVVYLARTGEPGHLPAARLMLESMLARSDEAAPRARKEAAVVLGLIPPPSELHTELMGLFHDADREVVEQALLAAGRVRSREFLSAVIEKLSAPALKAAARAALVLYGDRAVGTLKDYLNDPDVPLALRKELPEVLAQIPTPESAAVLAESLVQSDPGLRYDVLKALNKLCRRDRKLLPEALDFADMLDAELMGYYRSLQILAAIDPQAGAKAAAVGSMEGVTLVARALAERMEHEFERLFRLLALLYPARDVYNAYVGLTSHRPQLQANALEVLEHILKPDLYKRLAYTLDPEIKLPEKLRFAERFCHTKVESAPQALRILLHSGDNWLRACALFSIGKLKLVELSDELRGQPRDEGQLVAETWAWALRRLEASPAS